MKATRRLMWPPGENELDTPDLWSEILFKKDFYLFLERGEGREKDRERNISVWLPLTCPQLGTWPTTQACALSGNRTGDLLVCRLTLNPLSHTSQGWNTFYKWFSPSTNNPFATFFYIIKRVFLVFVIQWQLSAFSPQPATPPQKKVCVLKMINKVKNNFTQNPRQLFKTTFIFFSPSYPELLHTRFLQL